jgi:hypothetical protein
VALLAFALILIARFPAAWAVALLPPDLSCDAVEGTIWNGTCAGLMLHHQQLIGDLAWQLHPARLLAARLAAHVELTQQGDFANADAELAPGGQLRARDVHANVHLNPALIPQLPRGFGGTARAELALVEIKNGRLTDLRGTLEGHDLAQGSGAPTALGSYALSFAGESGGALVGALHDLGGPLAVTGTVRVTPEPGFVTEGTVAPRASASANLVQQLQMLGAPDAQGRRSFSIANTF